MTGEQVEEEGCRHYQAEGLTKVEYYSKEAKCQK
jgi:hypothetical protein